MDPAGELLLATGQGVGAAAPWGQKPLAVQVTQAALPLEALYMPGLHGTHAEPSAPVKPGRQVQLVGQDDKAGDEVLAGQTLSTPVQHHVLEAHAAQGALATPWYPRSQ